MQYRIEELCEQFGISRRTVRYYVQEGLLEAPAGRGRGGFYSAAHRERLARILALRAQGLPLALIRRELEADTLGAIGTGPTTAQPEGSVPEEAEQVLRPVPGIRLHVRGGMFRQNPDLYRRLAGQIENWLRENERNVP